VRLLELGAVILGLAFLARIAARFDLPTVPLFLLAGLAFGEGGILPLVTTRGFVETGAEIGLILVLFVLGLEHSSRDLLATARASTTPGLVDLVLNATPGVLAGLLLGWGPLAAAFLGGITYVSSSGVAAKLLEHAWPHARGASKFVVTIAVIEDGDGDLSARARRLTDRRRRRDLDRGRMCRDPLGRALARSRTPSRGRSQPDALQSFG
jgi:CPA2 family monovalent cation:H+ antiporter-2